MNKEKITFKFLTSHEYILLYLPVERVNDLAMFDEVAISLFKGNHFYILYKNDFALEAIRSLNTHLKLSLTNKAILHSSITSDIGYLWNEDLHYTELLADKEEHDKIEDWKGTKYLLWSSRGTSTWLYSEDNKIILKVTPTYKWHFQDPDEDEEFISYEEFIKNYKPLAKFELSRERAQEWLNKTEELLMIMERNYDKWRTEKDLKQNS